jgi:RES domain-containing protein
VVSSRHVAAVIGNLPRDSVTGHLFRHQATQWQYSQAGAGARTVGGRWNPPGSFATLYLAGSVEVAAAELHRLASRGGRAVDDFLPRHLLEYEVGLEAILDLTNPATLEAVGLGEEQLRSEDAMPCQEVGEAAHHLGREGILAPSATGAGDVLAVFVERLLPGSRLEIVSTTLWDIAPPGPT